MEAGKRKKMREPESKPVTENKRATETEKTRGPGARKRDNERASNRERELQRLRGPESNRE